MDKLKNALENIKGNCVDIYIKHSLFGDQHVKTECFIPMTNGCAGFKYQDRAIYIKDNLIKQYDILKNKVIIYSINKNIEIIKMS